MKKRGFDCALIVSTDSVEAFLLSKNLKVRRSLRGVVNGVALNFVKVSQGIISALNEMEKLSKMRIKSVLMITDLCNLKSKSFKKPENAHASETALRNKVEQYAGESIVALNNLHDTFEVFTASSENLLMLSSVLISIGIEDFEIIPDLLILPEIAPRSTVLKIGDLRVEICNISSDSRVTNYRKLPDFSIKHLIERISACLGLSFEACYKMVNHYNVASVTERMAIYYSREAEDKDIFEYISLNTHIYGMRKLIKNYFNSLVNYLKMNYSLEKKVYFYSKSDFCLNYEGGEANFEYLPYNELVVQKFSAFQDKNRYIYFLNRVKEVFCIAHK